MDNNNYRQQRENRQENYQQGNSQQSGSYPQQGQYQPQGQLDPQMMQQYQQYANNYQQEGNFNQLPHDQVLNHYQQFAQQVPPQQLYDAHQQYYQQMPPQQRQGLFDSLLSAFQQRGINPQQAGIQGNNPTPQNLAQVSQYVAQNPDLLQQVFGPNGALSSPIAKMALVGALAYAGKNLYQK